MVFCILCLNLDSSISSQNDREHHVSEVKHI